MLSLSLTSPISYFFLPLSCLFVIFITSPGFSFQAGYLTNLFLFDNFSFWLLYVTVLVLFFSGLIFRSHTLSFYCSNIILGVCSFVVFSCSSLFYLYVFFEFSLIPIIYIIINWGQYPDRFSSSAMILLYTAVFSFPLMIVIFYFFPYGSLLVLSGSDGVWGCSLWAVLVVFFSFSVKLPLYGVHHWLPIAHVEAPTPGSIILAGVLLKLGGCGLIRFSQVLPLYSLRGSITFYILAGVVLVSLISFCQSDFNRLVAYSSVVHISVLVLGVVACTTISYSSVLLVMVLHGFSSPIMFLLVGVVYSFSQTRLIAVLRGFLLVSPILSFFGLVGFISNIPTPPFSSFTAEVLLFLGFSYISIFFAIFVFLHVFLSVLFNSYWLTSTFFGRPISSISFYFIGFGEFITFLVFLLNLVFLSFFIFHF